MVEKEVSCEGEVSTVLMGNKFSLMPVTPLELCFETVTAVGHEPRSGNMAKRNRVRQSGLAPSWKQAQ